MAVSSIGTSSPYLSTLVSQTMFKSPDASPVAPWIVQDKITVSSANRPPLPGPASKDSPFYGQYTADGLALDANGLAVVVDDRTVLIKTANGRQIQAWGDILNDTTGQYSDVDKAKAYQSLASAWDTRNPNFTSEEKRAAAIVANRSDFAPRAMDLEQRQGEVAKNGDLRSLIAWYDTLQPWEQEYFSGQREVAEAMQLVFDGLEQRQKAGAYKSGDATPSDPEAKWLMGLFNKVVDAANNFWNGNLREAAGAIRDELRAGFQPSSVSA